MGFSLEALWHSFMRETPRGGPWLDNSHMTVEQAVKEILSRGRNPALVHRPPGKRETKGKYLGKDAVK